jgi:hypothetical protein
MRWLGLAVLLAAAPAAAADWSVPYGAVEAVSDGVYGLLRGQFFAAVLPQGLSRQMSRAPNGSSYAAFARRLRRNQDEAERRIVTTRPTGAQALSIETTVVADALADSLIGRYQLEKFGRASGAYASQARNWDPEFIASAAVLGGAYLYAAGLRADWTMGPVRVDLDTKPGAALRSALESGEGRSLLALSLRPKDSPLAARFEGGLSSGRATGERYGLSYSQRF